MTPELYVRWLSMLVFSANFHLHAVPGLMPTDFDEQTQEYIAHWFRWRYRLVPYVLGIIEESVRSGLPVQRALRSEEHTSELQSRGHLVCRLLLERKTKI